MACTSATIDHQPTLCSSMGYCHLKVPLTGWPNKGSACHLNHFIIVPDRLDGGRKRQERDRCDVFAHHCVLCARLSKDNVLCVVYLFPSQCRYTKISLEGNKAGGCNPMYTCVEGLCTCVFKQIEFRSSPKHT